ncbi:hypothetical protein [Leptotrichia massiliensis]|uniref:hypothetical protein n=1 Tax=Leptotrichia massiliensis TaxID=1852388 RepID=UPI0028D0D3C5|nr:hypothetical protein [Leptotrichia massiliensis]
MSKNLILFLLISFCSFSGGVDGKSIEESLNDLCEQLLSSCAKIQEEKFYKNVNEILLEKDFYKFSYKDKNREYKFFIPKGTVIKNDRKELVLEFYDFDFFSGNNFFKSLVYLKKKESSFELDTDNLEELLQFENVFLQSDDVGDYKNKVLEFRKRLLDRNKNFIKEKQDIEFEKNYKIKNLNNEMER